MDKHKIEGRVKTTVFIVVIVVLVLVLNIVVAAVVDKYNVKLDMTSNRLYALDEKTIVIAEGLTKDVKITVFNKEEEYLSVLNEYLSRYEQLSEFIDVKYVDPYTNPNIVTEYKNQGISIALNSIIIESGSRKKYFSLPDLYNMNLETGEIYGIIAEQKITSAILYVSNNEDTIVAFTDGHDEKPSNSLVGLFEDGSFEIQNISLAVQDIDQSCSVMVIPAPTRDFDLGELEKIDVFLAKGGNLIVFVEPAATSLPNLEGFLEEWGIDVGEEIVLEKQLYVNSNPLSIHGAYLPHPINDYFQDNRYFVVMPASRAMNVLFSVKNGVVVEGILSSSSQSYGKKGTQFTTLEKEEGDIDGPFYLAVASKKPIQLSETKRTEAKVVVVSSRDMYADDILNMKTYANADFLAQSINWIYNSEVTVSIPMKSVTSQPLNIMNYQAVIFAIIFILVIPFCIFIYGLVVFIKRRYL